MKNFIQPGENLTIPAPYDVGPGDVVAVGGSVGISVGTALSGEPADVCTIGVYSLAKVSALTINVGDLLYFDSATKLVNKTASGNTKLGHAVTAAANPSATVAVKLAA